MGITTDEALRFLEDHQPMPDDSQLTEDLIARYNEVRIHFLQSPDERAIPLFLRSFGNGSGFGSYQLIEDVLAQFPGSVVVPYLTEVLQRGEGQIGYWATQIAARFPSERLIPALAKKLTSEDFDTRYAAVTALEQIPSESATETLREALLVESDSELRELIDDVLRARRSVV